MATAAAPAPREQGWRRVLLALFAFLVLPLIPAVRAAVPIEETLVPLVFALAACAVVGWQSGGRLLLAVLWTALAMVMLVAPGRVLTPFEGLVRGWSLVLAATFGLVCVFQRQSPFLTRALSAVGIAFALGLVVVGAARVTVVQLGQHVESEYSRRSSDALARMAQVTSRPEWKEMETKWPSLAAANVQTQRQLDVLPRVAGVLFPALLALESLAALALAWAIYHRVGRVRLGAPLALLRDFRFSDQLVWGIIVGATVMLLPSLAAEGGRVVGANLLVFFGVLYALRGLGVVMWMAPSRFVMVFIISAAFLALPLLSAFALGVGLVDTWLDWRSRARPTT